MKYFSMFSGIGGFEYGIEKANNIRPAQSDFSQRSEKCNDFENEQLQRKCVGYSEIDKYAIQIYRKHYKGHKNYGDAKTIITDELPEFDLLVGGFPCQAFSIAGKRGGFNDTRGTLFFEIARILRDKRPRHFVLENVKGLLSHEQGKTFQTILGVLTDLGYRIEWQVLNSKHFGVPQNRERVFIVGHLRGECSGKIFPVEKGNSKYEGISQARCLDANMHKGIDAKGYFEKKRRNLITATVTTENAHGLGKNVTAKQVADVEILTDKIRRLTPIECERLQGFPDSWTEYGIDTDGNEVKISDTQRYKCLGNAVTTNVITAITEKLF